jgi:hypothetical protein
MSQKSRISTNFWKAVITTVPATPETTPRAITLLPDGLLEIPMRLAYPRLLVPHPWS